MGDCYLFVLLKRLVENKCVKAKVKAGKIRKDRSKGNCYLFVKQD